MWSESKKQKESKAKIKAVYMWMAENIEHYCVSCARWDKPLTHSHTIRRSYRKDLEAERENITYQCHQCHDIWDNKPNERYKLLDYEDRMRYIKSVDEGLFNRMR